LPAGQRSPCFDSGADRHVELRDALDQARIASTGLRQIGVDDQNPVELRLPMLL